MMDKRERLAAIFRDTQQFYSTDPELMAAIDAGRKNTKLYDADNIPDFPEEATGAGAVSVTKSRTFEAAMRLAKQHPGKRIAVLNFASATKPGGGVLSGSSAQEESLCRCSTLYPTLDRRFLWKVCNDVTRTIWGHQESNINQLLREQVNCTIPGKARLSSKLVH